MPFRFVQPFELGNNLGEGVGPPYVFTNSEAASYVARMPVQPNNAHKAAIDAIWTAWKVEPTLIPKLDYVKIEAAQGSGAAVLNLISTSYASTLVNSPTFTADGGIAGDGSTSYADEGFNPATAGGNFTQNSAFFAIWSKSPGPRAGSAAGWFDGTKGVTIAPRSLSDGVTARINQATAITAPVSDDGSGFYLVNRTGASTAKLYKNNVEIGTSGAASQSMVSGNFCLGRSATGTYTTHQFAASAAGAGLTVNEMTAFYNGLKAYMDAISPQNTFAQLKRFGFTYSGTDLHRGGTVAPNGKLYTTRRNNPIYTIINTDGSAYQNHLGLSGQTINTSGGAVGADGKIYQPPRDSTFVVVIDPTIDTATMETFGLTIEASQNKWTDGIAGLNGKIYCAPSIAQDMLVIDTNTSPATAIRTTFGLSWDPGGTTTDHLLWVSGVRAPNGKIFMAPYNASSVLVVDPATDTASFQNFGLTFGGVPGSDLWTGGAVGADGKLYFSPREADDILVIDPVAMTAQRKSYGLNLNALGSDKYARCVARGNMVYFMPSTTKALIELDTINQTARYIPIDGIESMGSPRYIYGILHTDGKIYCPPRDASHFLVF